MCLPIEIFKKKWCYWVILQVVSEHGLNTTALWDQGE